MGFCKACVAFPFMFTLIIVPLVASFENTEESNRSGIIRHVNSAQETQNIYLGERKSGDILLYSKIAKKRGVKYQVVLDYVHYSVTNATGFNRPPKNTRISYIGVSNLSPSETGGYATVVEGGIGHKNVTIFLYSQENQGYEFFVRIFGTKGGSDWF